MLVAGGDDGSGYLASTELFDPVTGTWSPAAPMSHARNGHTATLLGDGRVLVAGGDNTGSASLASAELFDPVMGTWSPAAPMSHARTDHTATLLGDGWVLVAGGDDGSGYLASAELFDPVTGTWSPAGTMYAARSFHTATLLGDGRVLVAGGNGPGASLGSVEVYGGLPLAAPCAAASACGSAFCVDGVCCNSPCTGPCLACSAAKKGAGLDGACEPVQTGTDPDDDCAPQIFPGCGNTGSCNGAGACQKRPPSTLCGTPSCTGPNLSQTPHCDGLGACLSVEPQLCGGNLLCQAGSCLATCAINAHCIDTAYCTSSGACLPKHPLGAPCALPQECITTACLAGACALDDDSDAIADDADNCPAAPNTTQTNTDLTLPGGDPDGDACDDDDDADDIPDTADNCPLAPNPGQADINHDGTGDACDCDDPPKPDGTSCDDGNPCTQTDTCQNAVCTGSDPFVCPQPDPIACKVAICEPATGACELLYKLDGAPCPGGECIAGGCFTGQVAGSSSASSGGAGGGGAGGGEQGGGGTSTTGSTTAAGSGGAGGPPPAAHPESDAPLRMYGNGCSLARAADPAREGTTAPWLLTAALLAARCRRRVSPTRARRAGRITAASPSWSPSRRG